MVSVGQPADGAARLERDNQGMTAQNQQQTERSKMNKGEEKVPGSTMGEDLRMQKRKDNVHGSRRQGVELYHTQGGVSRLSDFA